MRRLIKSNDKITKFKRGKVRCFSKWLVTQANTLQQQAQIQIIWSDYLVKDLLKVGLSPSKRIYFYLLKWKLFKNDKKYFLFHLKSFFRSQDIDIFVLTFWSCRRNALIRKKMIMMMMNCFCGMVDGQKAFKHYLQPGPLSGILTILNFRHAASRISTCAEPEFRLCWMKLCNSDNHYTKVSFKIFDVTTWLTNNYNTHIAQYLTK